jgi:hypothetical protein
MLRKSPQNPKPLISIVLLLFIVIACSNGTGNDEDFAAQLLRDYGITSHRIFNQTQLPDLVIYRIENNEATVELSPIDDAHFQTYLKLVQKALLKYPIEIVKKEIKALYIGGPYQENGGVITGMYERDKIYLFYNHNSGDNSPLFLEQSFHHELSSILIRDYAFPAFDWLALNPEGFSYIINPIQIDSYMNSIDSYDANDSILKQGLVSTYGKVNAENDINTYAELVFTQPEKMKKYITKYPVVSKKFHMLKQFYLSISPEFGAHFNLIEE